MPATPGGTTAQRFAALASSVSLAAAATASLAAAATAAQPALDGAGVKMRALAAAAVDVKNAVAQTQAAGGAGHGGPTGAFSGDAAIIAKLQELEGRLRQLDPTGYFAETVKQRIGYIQAGTQSGAEALEFLRQLFAQFFPGLMQEAASGDQAVQNLALELERFSLSGVFL